MAIRTLDNGLRVVVSPTPGLGVVAVNIWYDVGSRHEQPDRQGFAHLFEHLMFQGSRHVQPGEHFALVQGNGGIAQRDDLVRPDQLLRGGAERAPSISRSGSRLTGWRSWTTCSPKQNFDTQVAVVAAERSQRMDNVPYGTVFEELLPLSSPPTIPTAICRSATWRSSAEATLDGGQQLPRALLHAEQRRAHDRR